MDDPFGRWCLAIVCFALSALMSACETALRYANEEELIRRSDRLRALIREERVPVSTLHGIRIFLWMAFAWQVIRAVNGPWWADVLCCAGCAVVALPLAQLLPGGIAKKEPEKTLERLSVPVIVLCTLLNPLTRLLTFVANALLRLAGVDDPDREEVTEEEIKQMVDIGEESGVLEQSEHEMIENVLEFNDLSAVDCMTHRTDVTAFRLSDDVQTILKTIRETGLSRFPVYDEDIDDIVGILATRDFLLNMEDEHPKPLRALLRKPYMVPETVKTDVLLRNMQRVKTHIAIVVDEYGGVSGIITMEDLLEEIVGNIYDEFDTPDEAQFTKLEDDTWEVSGTAELDTLAEEMNVTLPEEDYDTFGGLVFSRFGVIPADGTTPSVDIWCTPDGEKPEEDDDEEAPGTCDLMHVQVLKIEDRRVEKAKVTLERGVPLKAPEQEDDKEE